MERKELIDVKIVDVDIPDVLRNPCWKRAVTPQFGKRWKTAQRRGRGRTDQTMKVLYEAAGG